MKRNGAIDNEEAIHLIDKVRTQMGISEYEMCKRAGISQGAFSNVKRNRRRMESCMARNLASALKISPIQLFEAAGILPRSDHA